MWGLGRLVGVCVVLAGLAAGGWWYAVHWRPPTTEYAIQGVNVTAATGAVDWGMAHARDVDFAYVRATMGARGRDDSFAGHWQALRTQGIRRGALHLYSLCSPAAEQADHFNATVPRVSDALPAVVAFEFTPGCAARPDRPALLAGIAEFMERVERHTGSPVLIRVTEDFEETYRLSGAVDRTLWATGDWFEPDYLARPWRMWQANAARRVEGFEQPVGWDVVAS